MSYNSELHIQMQDELIAIRPQVEEGELSHLDALITMRQNKEQLEKTLEIIKEFETDFYQEIANKASEYGGKYQGYDIKAVNGKRTFKYDNVPEVVEVLNKAKTLSDKYKTAFEGFQKGTVQTTRMDENDENSPLGWIDENGVVNPFPELSIAKSYFTVTKSKNAK